MLRGLAAATAGLLLCAATYPVLRVLDYPTAGGFRMFTGGDATWSPAQLGSSLVAWYDANDPTTITHSSNAVSQWNDKSGNGNHLVQATGSKKPTYDATGFFGKGAIILDGTSDTMKTGETVNLGTNVASMFAFAQMPRSDISAANGRLLSFQGTGQAADYTSPQNGVFIGLNAGKNQIRAERGSTLSISAAADGTYANLQYGNFYRLASIFDGANHTLYLNTVARPAVASTGNFASPGTLRFSSYVDDSANWQGRVKEIIVLNRAATSDERAQIDAHLKSSWTRVITTEGDSLVSGTSSAGELYGYVWMAGPSLSPAALIHNIAQGGSRLDTNPGDVVDRTANADGQIPANKAGRRYIFYIAIGHNDTPTLAGQDAWVELLMDYCNDRLAAGYDEIVVATILPRSDAAYPNHNTDRATLNPKIRTACAANGFTVCDLAAHPIMGVNGASDDTNIYGTDKIHPNAAGMLLLEDTFTATINGL